MGISLCPDTQCIFQSIDHGISRCNLGAIVQMGIDISSCRKVTVSQPLLDLLHRNVVCQNQTSAAVSKIVEPNFTQAILFQNGTSGNASRYGAIKDLDASTEEFVLKKDDDFISLTF